jgi:hypothetical protein
MGMITPVTSLGSMASQEFRGMATPQLFPCTAAMSLKALLNYVLDEVAIDGEEGMFDFFLILDIFWKRWGGGGVHISTASYFVA